MSESASRVILDMAIQHLRADSSGRIHILAVPKILEVLNARQLISHTSFFTQAIIKPFSMPCSSDAFPFTFRVICSSPTQVLLPLLLAKADRGQRTDGKFQVCADGFVKHNSALMQSGHKLTYTQSHSICSIHIISITPNNRYRPVKIDGDYRSVLDHPLVI
jgi:hypothetical protein